MCEKCNDCCRQIPASEMCDGCGNEGSIQMGLNRPGSGHDLCRACGYAAYYTDIYCQHKDRWICSTNAACVEFKRAEGEE